MIPTLLIAHAVSDSTMFAQDAWTVFAAASSSHGARAAAPVTPSAAKSADAPADEYFGPFKYSAVSVRTKIDALGRSYRERWSDDASIMHDAGLVESSYQAWAERYPKDVWLAPTGFHLAQLYDVIQTAAAREHAKQMFAYVAKHFPASKEGHLSRLRLQHFPALHAESSVRPTPSPYGSPPASPRSSAAPASSAPGTASTAMPVATPTASTQPAATPSTQAAPKASPSH